MDDRDFNTAHHLDADRIHAPNGNVDLSRLPSGAKSIAYRREELAGTGSGE
jgi:hypothetical protein